MAAFSGHGEEGAPRIYMPADMLKAQMQESCGVVRTYDEEMEFIHSRFVYE